jgi:hypothetical protein
MQPVPTPKMYENAQKIVRINTIENKLISQYQAELAVRRSA